VKHLLVPLLVLLAAPLVAPAVETLVLPGGRFEPTDARAKELADQLDPLPPPQCSDGINNDLIEDSLIDHPADPACESATAASESPNAFVPRPAFSLGVTERDWPANDELAQSKLGYRFVRFDGNIAPHAARYAQKGIKAIKLEASSANWPALRDSWLAYGPRGTVQRGIITHLEVGNEESYSYKSPDAYTAGRAHASAVRSLKTAVPDAPIICQGDEAERGTGAFFRGMRDANPQIASDCSMYSIHPYGPRAPATMDVSRTYITNILGDTDPFAATEWGVSVRHDQGCVSHNYGWPACMTQAEAAERLRRSVAYLKSRGDVRFVMFFQNTDQQTNSSASREHNFGLLSSYQTGEQAKGAYTTEARRVIAANP
jgi:hypothetical protein